MISEKNYLDLMVPFYDFVKKQCRKSDNGLSYYGTGESAHWAIQSNYNVAGALAVMAETACEIPLDKDELREKALELFRYNLHTHVTGEKKCSNGLQWGGSWITVLGLERMVAGQLALEKYFSAEDQERFRNLRIFESLWILDNFETVAGLEGNSKRNKPESDFWNGSFIYRTVMDHPDVPRKEELLEKSTALLLNAISHPLDAASEKLFDGKPLRQWNVGFNFTANYSLDHHCYMNVGYSVVTLSHAAYLWHYCKARNIPFPAAAALHVKDLWEVVKNFVAPDGRMIRIGGDTRARYCYCQMYLLPVLIMMKELFGDTDCAILEKGMLDLLQKEQQDNPDGSFFGTRLAGMRTQSRYYYTRLESDPIAALAFGADHRRRFGAAELPETNTLLKDCQWSDDFHCADMVRTSKTFRSVVRRGSHGPMALALTLDDSSLAEWQSNGFTQMQGHNIFPENASKFHEEFPGGFITSGSVRFIECEPWGEGEAPMQVALGRTACAALPDGKSMIVLEKTVCVKECALSSLRSIGWKIPNDVHNGYTRSFSWEHGSANLKKGFAPETIDTGSSWLTVEDKLFFLLGYGADSFKIYIPEKPMGCIKSCRYMTSLYMNEICGSVIEDEERRIMPGEVMSDTGYAVMADVPTDKCKEYSLELVESSGDIRCVKFTSPAGTWLFAANFGDEEIVWEGKSLAAAECALKQL